MKDYLAGYPPPTVQWYKKAHREKERILESDGIGVAIETYQDTATQLVSRLVLRSVDQEDTAVYRCQAGGASQVR